MRRIILSVVLVIAAVWPASGCGGKRKRPPSEAGRPSGKLIVFHAGSLAVPFAEVSAAFSKEYPGVRVVRETAVSRSCARKISDLNRPCDVMASADYTVIESLLIPKHAGWVIRFATNEMAIVYGDRSRLADQINADNWHEILARDDIAVGRSDPNTDPCGYRTVWAIQLAEKHYGLAGLADRLLAKDRGYVRSKETDLLALLELGEIDYIFLYRSVAEQHGLRYLRLPDEVSLGKAELADLYRTVSAKISGKTPGSSMTKTGAPMVYGVTIPHGAPNVTAAIAFVEFLLDDGKGMAILRKHGQGSLVPAPTDTLEQIPGALWKFARETK